MSPSESNIHQEVYKHFVDAGCCRACCLRLLGNRNKSSYKSVEESLKEEDQVPEEIQLEPDQGYHTTVDDAKEALKILTCFFEEHSKKAETLLALDVLNRNIDDVTRDMSSHES